MKSQEAGCPVPLNMPAEHLHGAGSSSIGLAAERYRSAIRARGPAVPMFRHLNQAPNICLKQFVSLPLLFEREGNFQLAPDISLG